MSVSATDEQPRAATSTGFGDAVTFAFGDLDAEVFGIARLGLAGGPGAPRQANGLAVLFAGADPVAVRAAGGLPTGPEAGWEAIDAAGVRTTTVEPLRAWEVSFTGDDGSSGFRLRFDALSGPAHLEPDAPAAAAGGMEGYEQLCRVTGVATVRGQERAVSCLGQRGHAWGEPDWDRLALARTVTAWMGDDLAVSVSAVRRASARTHADEDLSATLFLAPADDADCTPLDVPEARLSTTTDAEGRQRRGSLELFLDDEDPGHRAAGEVLCGTSLDLGRLRLDCSFFVWRMEGRTGVGRYDVLRQAA